MNNIKNNVKYQFTICPNALLNDESLSRDAKFLFIWMASKPNDWTFYQEATAKTIGCKDYTLRKYIDELCEAGWITKQRIRTKKGKFSHWHYTLNPYPVYKKPTMDKNHNGQNHTLNNKDLEQINNLDIERQIVKYFIYKVHGKYEAIPGPETYDNIKAILRKATPEQLKTVIDKKAAQFHAGEIDARIFNMKWLLRPDNFFTQLSIIENPANKKNDKFKGKTKGVKVATKEQWEEAAEKYKDGWL